MPGVSLTELYEGQLKPNRIELSDLGRAAVYDVRDFDQAVVQAAVVGSWGAGVITIQRSSDGVTWAGCATAVTFGADGFSSVIDTKGSAFLRAIATTAGTAGNFVDISVKGWQQP